jgi:hypothetical protein
VPSISLAIGTLIFASAFQMGVATGLGLVVCVVGCCLPTVPSISRKVRGWLPRLAFAFSGINDSGNFLSKEVGKTKMCSVSSGG